MNNNLAKNILSELMEVQREIEMFEDNKRNIENEKQKLMEVGELLLKIKNSHRMNRS